MKLLYLTGMPASGKTTITDTISELDSSIQIIRYSDEIKKFYFHKAGIEYTTSQLREASSQLITPNDIGDVDQHVLEKIQSSTASRIVLESHALTFEPYGYRATPFSLSVLNLINPSIIVCLYSEATVIRNRTIQIQQGRQFRSVEDISVGQYLQMSLALQYAVQTNTAAYFIDTNQMKTEEAAKWIMQKLAK